MTAVALLVSPPFRSRKVLAHARGQRCTLRLGKFCTDNPETTVSAHIRDRHKGMAQKASDHSIVFACAGCHVALDEGHWIGVISETEVLRAIIRALQETWEILIQDNVIPFPHDRVVPPSQRPVRPRKSKELRAKVPSGKKMQSRNNLRRSSK